MAIELLIPIFGILIVLVPVIGITTVLTIRLGGKPLIETLAREMRDPALGSPADTRRQIAALTDQVEALTEEVRRLRDVRAFDERLIAAKDDRA